MKTGHDFGVNKITRAGVLITLGIIFGDIGTSPLYVLKAIIGDEIINQALVLGGISCVFWTLTFQTTIKYVLITLRADNHGEGGVFSLYALVRRKAKWLYIPAIIGGAALLADSILTPSISVMSAVEGLSIYRENVPVIPIVIGIITVLFISQQFGTSALGRTFGPIMLLWFLMLAVLGIMQLSDNMQVLAAVNPQYAWNLLVNYPQGFWILGAVFLCTTGAEALYSDLGHCGRGNIQVSWIFVKMALLLNYFGQGAWLLKHQGGTLSGNNPFYSIMPQWFLITGIIIATCAVIVASQALITGAFTLVNEAIRLNFWPKLKIVHPTDFKGQIYVPTINWLLWAGCIITVIYFGSSENMESAYGLSIIITMLMTTLLVTYYLFLKRVNVFLILLFVIIYSGIECMFLLANLQKFSHGGWITLVIAISLSLIMWIWYQSRKIRNKYLEFTQLDKYFGLINAVSEDHEVPKFSTHLVFLTRADNASDIEHKIIYSLFHNQPKRADVYWLIHVDVQDTPFTQNYKVTELLKDKVFRIDFNLGFRIEPRLNLLFKIALDDMRRKGEVDIYSRYKSLLNENIVGDFKFVVLEKFLSNENELPVKEKLIMKLYFFMKEFSLSEEKAFGLETVNVMVEKIPLILHSSATIKLKRCE